MDVSDLHYETTVEVRYTDLDTFGHVNNAVYATLCEEARVHYCADVLDQGVHDISFVIVRLELDYHKTIPDVGAVTAAIGITDIGRTSFTMQYELSYEGETVATAETVQVTVDEDGTPVEVPDDWADRITAASP